MEQSSTPWYVSLTFPAQPLHLCFQILLFLCLCVCVFISRLPLPWGASTKATREVGGFSGSSTSGRERSRLWFQMEQEAPDMCHPPQRGGERDAACAHNWKNVKQWGHRLEGDSCCQQTCSVISSCREGFFNHVAWFFSLYICYFTLFVPFYNIYHFCLLRFLSMVLVGDSF